MLCVYISSIIKYKKELNSLLINASDFRIKKYNELKNEENKLQSIVATHLIDVHLNTIGLKEKNMVYASEKYGKTYFQNVDNTHFSISHSKNLVAVAFSDKKVGIDIQVVKNIDDKIYKKVLNENEFVSIDTKDMNLYRECFFYYWVQKEASIKRAGNSICSELKNINYTYSIVKRIRYDANEHKFISCDDIIDIKDVLCKNDKIDEDIDVYYLCINNMENEKENIIVI